MLEEFAERLKAARVAAGANQSDFATWGGAKKNSQISYEAGKTAPSVEYLLRLQEHGVDIAYLLTGRQESQARQLLEEVAVLIEAGDDDAVRALRPDLERVAHDPDVAPNLRNQALYLVGMLGSEAAKRLHREAMSEIATARDRARASMENAIERAQEVAGVDIGEGARQAVMALCGQLLLVTPESIPPGALDWSIESLVRSIGALPGGQVPQDSTSASATLHDRRPDYRAEED